MKTGIGLSAAVLSAALFLSTGEASAQGKFIVNELSGKCIDVSGAPGVKNGAPLILYACEFSGKNPNGSQTDQQWQLTPEGLIRHKLSGNCIDVVGNPGSANGAHLQLATCEVAGGPSDQYWRVK